MNNAHSQTRSLNATYCTSSFSSPNNLIYLFITSNVELRELRKRKWESQGEETMNMILIYI